MFKKVLEFLKALPVDQQRFASGDYYSTSKKCYCALGALQNDLKYIPSDQQHSIITSIAREHGRVTLFNDFNLTPSEAKDLQEANDRFQGTVRSPATPERRYEYVIDWLEEQVKNEES